MHRSDLTGSAVARRVPVVSFTPRPPPLENGTAHGPGLYVICGVVLYERLASVMVFSLLVLYLNECLRFGAGWSAKVASYVYGLSYVAGVVGGMLADRGLGNRHAALSGLVLLALGYSALGFGPTTTGSLWAAGTCFIAGSGLLKPSCTALVGALSPQRDPRRAYAFRSFYYVVNVGALLGPCIGGLVRTWLGWGVIFRLAASSIAVSFLMLALGKRYLLHGPPAVTALPPTTDADIMPNPSRSGALVLVLAVLAMFGAALSQSYGTLLLWARDDTRRSLLGYVVPPDWFAALPAGFVLLLGPLVERCFKVLLARGHTPTDAGKFTAGMLLCALAYALMLTGSLFHHGPALASPLWLVGCKVALALGELLGVPVGLALAETLAHSRYKGLTMGLSYGSTALGYWLGAEVSALWPVWSHTRFFGSLALGCLVAASLIQSQSRRLEHVVTK